MIIKTKKSIFWCFILFIVIFLYSGIKSIYYCKTEYQKKLQFEALSFNNEIKFELEFFEKIFLIIANEIKNDNNDNKSKKLKQIKVSEENIKLLGPFNNFNIALIVPSLKRKYTVLGDSQNYNEKNNKQQYKLSKLSPNKILSYLNINIYENKAVTLLMAIQDDNTDNISFLEYQIALSKISKNLVNFIKDEYTEVSINELPDDETKKLSESIESLFLPSSLKIKSELPFVVVLKTNKEHYYNYLYQTIINNIHNLLIMGSFIIVIMIVSAKSFLVRTDINNKLNNQKIKDLENFNQSLQHEKNKLVEIIEKTNLEEKERKKFIQEINDISYNSLINIINKESSEDNEIYATMNLQETLILSSDYIDEDTIINVEDLTDFIQKLFSKEMLLKNASLVEQIDISFAKIEKFNKTFLKIILFYFLNKVVISLPRNGIIKICLEKSNHELIITIIDNGFHNRSGFITEIENLGQKKKNEPNLFNQLNFNESFILKLMSLLRGKVVKETNSDGLNKIKISLSTLNINENFNKDDDKTIENNVIALFKNKRIK